LLTLVGGGIGYILVFVPTWAFATRINKPLNGWKNMLPLRLRKILAALWIYSLGTATISLIILMELGIFGYVPGIKNPDIVLNIVFGFLFASAILACITFICALALDIEEQNNK
jgi:biotin transporter BioY